MLDFYLNNDEGLSEFVGRNGGAHTLLHFGLAQTKTIGAELTFNTKAGSNLYGVELGSAIGDKLFFKDERVTFVSKKHPTGQMIPLGSGGSQSRLLQITEADTEYTAYNLKTIRTIKSIMKKWGFYQFHNTTKDAYIRGAVISMTAAISEAMAGIWLLSYT